MPVYRYYYGMRLRGYSPGAQPDGVVEHQYDVSGKYWDIIAYNHPLTEEECFMYDLEYIETKPFDAGRIKMFYVG